MKLPIPMPACGSGVTLFSKLIRTKELQKLQGEDPRSKKPKLTVSTCVDDDGQSGRRHRLFINVSIVSSVRPFNFQKCLTTLDLTSLGVGSCCGTGMYLVAGMVARNIAGPGVIFSFIIAAVASIFSGN